MSETSAAARALGRSRKITLANGQQYNILFSLYTLCVIEDELGSIDAISEAFDGKGAGNKKVVRVIGKMLANALVDDAGNPIQMDEETVMRQVAIEDIATVFGQIQSGLGEAFPQAAATAAAPNTTNVAAMTDQLSSSGNHFATSGAPSSDNLTTVSFA